MKHQSPSSLRNIIIALTTTAAALAVTLGMPPTKSFAASPGMDGAPSHPDNGHPDKSSGSSTGIGVGVNVDLSSAFSSRQKPRQEAVQAVHVNPTAVHLIKIATAGLTDSSLAERIFRDPDAVATENKLSENETKVLKQMTRERFATAREDAAHVAAQRLADAGERGKPTQEEIDAIAGRMVVGRSILAAVGRSYLDAADAHACCPWNKAIQIGVNSDPEMYASVFAR
jgi:hypothetical protein